jgi:hypothetical protein
MAKLWASFAWTGAFRTGKLKVGNGEEVSVGNDTRPLTGSSTAPLSAAIPSLKLRVLAGCVHTGLAQLEFDPDFKPTAALLGGSSGSASKSF